ncbi:MAG: permease [Geitlerinemataceae cyanobacterium]
MKLFNNGFTIFLSLLVEALPFLLLGVLFSSALLLFINERQLIKRLPRNPILGALSGSLVGFLFPVCECGNIPVARRLLLQGVSPAVAVGFLLAAPTINPIVIWSTWVAFRDQPEIVVLRVVFSLIVATVIGALFSIGGDLRSLLHPNLVRAMPKVPSPSPKIEKQPALLSSGTYLLGQSGTSLRLDNLASSEDLLEAIAPDAAIALGASGKRRWELFVDNTIAELRELGGVLVLGSAIAAFIQVAVPREAILNLGQGPITSILVMLGLAALVSICSTVDAFFALSFSSAFTSGSLLAFLVFGPTIDLKSIGLLLSIFRPRAIAYLFFLTAQLTFILTLLVNLHWS